MTDRSSDDAPMTLGEIEASLAAFEIAVKMQEYFDRAIL